MSKANFSFTHTFFTFTLALLFLSLFLSSPIYCATVYGRSYVTFTGVNGVPFSGNDEYDIYYSGSSSPKLSIGYIPRQYIKEMDFAPYFSPNFVKLSSGQGLYQKRIAPNIGGEIYFLILNEDSVSETYTIFNAEKVTYNNNNASSYNGPSIGVLLGVILGSVGGVFCICCLVCICLCVCFC